MKPVQKDGIKWNFCKSLKISCSSVLLFSLFRLEEPCDGCAAPYGFRHIMPLTIDTRTFAVRKKCLKNTPWHSDRHGGAFLLFFCQKPKRKKKSNAFFIVKET